MPEFDCTLEFRDIQGFPGYKVGSDGSVWSCWRRGPAKTLGPWRELKPQRTNKHGHRHVILCPGYVQRAIHHLVLEAFVGPRPEGMQCCHSPDPNPANNARVNLRWGTAQDNANDRERHGHTPRGESSGRAKLTRKQVVSILADHAAGVTQPQLAAQHGVSQAAINLIIRRRNWRHVQ